MNFDLRFFHCDFNFYSKLFSKFALLLEVQFCLGCPDDFARQAGDLLFQELKTGGFDNM